MLALSSKAIEIQLETTFVPSWCVCVYMHCHPVGWQHVCVQQDLPTAVNKLWQQLL